MPCWMSDCSAVWSTSLNSSSAVWPSRSLSACGSLRPGTCDDDAVVALADDRRLARAERVDALAHDFGRAVHRVVDRERRARRWSASGRSGCRRRPRCPSRAARSGPRRWSAAEPLARGIDLAGSSSRNDRRLPAVEMSPIADAGSALRSAARTVSSIVSSAARRPVGGSASSRRWLPPARSSPRLTIGLGSAAGQFAPVSENQRGDGARARRTA